MHAQAYNQLRTDVDILAEWLDSARRSGVEDPYRGKRARPWVTWPAPITVEVLNAAGAAAPAYAYTYNISEGGMGLRYRQPVEVFTRIRVTLDETGESLYGQVRHCTPTPTGFVIGIQFELDANDTTALRKSA